MQTEKLILKCEAVCKGVSHIVILNNLAFRKISFVQNSERLKLVLKEHVLHSVLLFDQSLLAFKLAK